MRQQEKVATYIGSAVILGLALAHGHAGGVPLAGGLPQSIAAAPAPSSISGNVALGQRLASAYGWGSGAQWNCLYDLWERESGWSNTAENQQSGAYGIAQALGHGPTNQYPAGPANPPTSDPASQERWGLGYVRDRYGTPCGAWAQEEAANWY